MIAPPAKDAAERMDGNPRILDIIDLPFVDCCKQAELFCIARVRIRPVRVANALPGGRAGEGLNREIVPRARWLNPMRRTKQSNARSLTGTSCPLRR
jgi:hypothetical protein